MDINKDIKAVTFKFYNKTIAHDYLKAKNYLDSILYDNKDILTFVELYDDHDDTIGYHFNGLLQSTNYKHLLSHYKNKGPNKDKNTFMFMKSIPPDEIPHWRKYYLKRQCQYNTKRLLFQE